MGRLALPTPAQTLVVTFRLRSTSGMVDLTERVAGLLDPVTPCAPFSRRLSGVDKTGCVSGRGRG